MSVESFTSEYNIQVSLKGLYNTLQLWGLLASKRSNFGLRYLYLLTYHPQLFVLTFAMKKFGGKDDYFQLVQAYLQLKAIITMKTDHKTHLMDDILADIPPVRDEHQRVYYYEIQLRFHILVNSDLKKKPKCWFRYINDTLVIWPHGWSALSEFLQHLNSLHTKIKFTKDIEGDGKPLFLYVLVSREANNRLAYAEYRKKLRKNEYKENFDNKNNNTKFILKELRT
ncbi:hypothetical protein NQ318_011304 [Aromia moschata]|uniref:Uncharacterized protein n=1 Tax=Aromia moschata TaxID=1265417 RepID=A0AAV8XUV0_9CUCU|nr:hypothetical protein NQ318_011304 [Aromia moschata]